MSTEWYYGKQGQQFGPISSVQLQELALSSKLKHDDLVWKKGMDQWVRASRVKGLFSRPQAATPPPLPPVLPLSVAHAATGMKAEI